MVNNGKGLSVDGIKEMRGGEYVLDGYITLANPKVFKDENGMEYSIQYYQKKHKNEYVIKSKKGDCCLYKNGLLKMIWKEDVDGNRMGEFVSFDKGRISFIQNFDNLLNGNEWIRMINDKRGECMEIWKGDKVVYRGEYNDEFGREGMGMVYNEENGDIEYEGVFVDNELVRICKIFEGNEMMEFVDNGNNVDVANQIPIYVGGYIVDENDGSFKRNGLGYLIDENKRIAARECIYESGKELTEKYIFDGWYRKRLQNHIHINNHPNPSTFNLIESVPVSSSEPDSTTLQSNVRIRISDPDELNGMSFEVSDLVISSNCCNDLTSLDLNQYKCLQSIEIGSNSFKQVNAFMIDGLNELKSLMIGENSFAISKNSRSSKSSRSFQILNCMQLESIEIGRYSFSGYGKFELRNLSKLSTIKIGEIGSESLNFSKCSFVVRGIRVAIDNE